MSVNFVIEKKILVTQKCHKYYQTGKKLDQFITYPTILFAHHPITV